MFPALPDLTLAKKFVGDDGEIWVVSSYFGEKGKIYIELTQEKVDELIKE